MKIRTQSLLLLFLGMAGIVFAGYLTRHQLALNNRITAEMQTHQRGLVILNDFQVSANNQVLYGVDLIRTGDISGERIVPYRMTETRFNREIENLNSLKGLDPELDPLIDSLAVKAGNLARLCKEDMMDPLYSHQPLREGIIEQLIYGELDGIVQSSNEIRSRLSDSVKRDLHEQSVKRERFLYRFLPSVGAGLLFLYLCLYFIIHRSISHINRTRGYLGVLARGQGRLDVSLPAKGRDEISALQKNFNSFMGNLKSRHEALSGIAERQLASGETLSRVSLEYAGTAGQISRSLSAVDAQTGEINEKVKSSAREAALIAGTLDSLEQLSRQQVSRVTGMASRGQNVYDSLSAQQAAIEKQVELTGLVRIEGENNRKILELLKEQIGNILEQSEEISGAIRSIEDLAGQTDVLAINASIEAAHAGAYGRGFAVVAGEMRRLSHKVRDNSGLVTELLDSLNRKLLMMAEEEQQNRESISRLIRQNSDAEEVIQSLESSMKGIQDVIQDFFHTLEEVRTGSAAVHGETERVRSSGAQISEHMEQLNIAYRQMSREWDEISLGIRQLSAASETLKGLSSGNRESAETLNEEIRKLGS